MNNDKDDELRIPEFLRRQRDPNREWVAPPLPEKSALKSPPRKKEEVKERKNPGIDIQAATREKFAAIIGEIEGMIDDGEITPDYDFYRFLLRKEYPPRLANEIFNHFFPHREEIREAILRRDPDIIEAYKTYSKNELVGFDKLFTRILEDSSRYASNVKSLRALSKKKLPSVEKLTKNLPFARTCEKFNLVSVDPSTIIGAQELWTFKVAENILTVYRALDKKGLTLKSSTVTNIDEKTTLSKRIGRNTDERLKTVLTGGKIQLRKLMDEINGDTIPVTRITKNTILLRTVT